MSEQKNLLWTERLGNLLGSFNDYGRAGRNIFRTDAKATMCAGIPADDAERIRRGLYFENGMFYLSRLYVPCALFVMYRRGNVFEERFTGYEGRAVLRVAITMYVLAMMGYVGLRFVAKPVMDKHQRYDENELNKKAMDDYLVQRDYFRSREEAFKRNKG